MAGEIQIMIPCGRDRLIKSEKQITPPFGGVICFIVG